MANVDQFVRLAEDIVLGLSKNYAALSDIKSSARPKRFRGLDEAAIAQLLMVFKQSIKEILTAEFGEHKLLPSTDDNQSGGDGWVETEEGTFILELKFGGATDGNIGFKSMWSICPELEEMLKPWSLAERKNRLAKYKAGEWDESDILAWNKEAFALIADVINTEQIVLTEQGAEVLEGIVSESGTFSGTRTLRFTLGENGGALFEDSKDVVRDTYKVKAVATDKRLTIFFEGENSTVKAVLHGKNTVHVDGCEPLSGKTLLGTPCFNVWLLKGEKRPVGEVEGVDEYFTRDEVVTLCKAEFEPYLKRVEEMGPVTYIEPSVGAGAFIDSDRFWQAWDISNRFAGTQHVLFHHEDFLEATPQIFGQAVALGNPPFGKRSKLALEFLNTLALRDEAVLIGFILPIQFDKYLTQSKVADNLKLLKRVSLPQDAFVSPLGEEYKHLRTAFYIWGQGEVWSEDLRVREKPPITHPDFNLWQYNRTKEAMKYFDQRVYPWDFAVLRQGYGDYSRRYLSADELNPKHQYMFIQAKNEDAYDRLWQLDYDALSQWNTATPGFGKADLVQFYSQQ